MTWKTHTREISVAIAIAALAAVLAIAAPGYFAHENLSDLFLANIPVLVVALGMTLVILTGWPISMSRPVPACRLPNAAERYQEVRQAVTALPSMARAAPCGLSPEP